KHGCSIHEPNDRRAIVVLPEDVGFAVAIEISAGHHMPCWSRIGTYARPTDERGSIQKPNGRGAVGVLPENVAVEIAVEIRVCRTLGQQHGLVIEDSLLNSAESVGPIRTIDYHRAGVSNRVA